MRSDYRCTPHNKPPPYPRPPKSNNRRIGGERHGSDQTVTGTYPSRLLQNTRQYHQHLVDPGRKSTANNINRMQARPPNKLIVRPGMELQMSERGMRMEVAKKLHKEDEARPECALDHPCFCAHCKLAKCPKQSLPHWKTAYQVVMHGYDRRDPGSLPCHVTFWPTLELLCNGYPCP
jgi:hypothetical protein